MLNPVLCPNHGFDCLLYCYFSSFSMPLCRYMSSTLLRVAREHSLVVAVVGKGHLQGIKKHWKQPVSVNDLLEIPSQKPVLLTGKILTSIGVAVAGVAIISGLYLSSKK